MSGLTDDISNIEVIKKIIKIMGVDETVIKYVKDRPGHDRRYAIDWTTINKELGWSPKHSFETALTETVEWFKTHGEWWKRIKSGEYKDYYNTQYK